MTQSNQQIHLEAVTQCPLGSNTQFYRKLLFAGNSITITSLLGKLGQMYLKHSDGQQGVELLTAVDVLRQGCNTSPRR